MLTADKTNKVPNGTLPAKSVLLIEDDEGLNRLIQKKLIKSGFTVNGLFNGRDVIAHLKENQDILLLLDLVLPDISGREIIEEITRQQLEVPFIVMTGHGDEKTAVEMMKMGARDYIIKDSGFLEHLVPTIQRACNEINIENKFSSAEKSLLSAAQEWQITSDTIKDAVSLLDPDSKIIRCNEAMQNLLGKPLEEIVGQSCCQLMHGHPGPIADCPYQRSIKSKQKEKQVLSVNDSFLDVTVYPVLDNDGILSGAVHIVADITGRKHAEEDLQKNEAKFRGVFHQAAVGMARAAIDGTWLEFNNKLAEIVGYSQEELLSKTFQDITHPEDLQTGLDYVDQLLKDEIKTFSMEKRYFKKNGDIVWVNLTTSLVRDINNDPEYFIKIIEDISQRKKGEEELRNSIVNLKESVKAGRVGLWNWNLITNQVYYSAEWKRQIGYKDHEISNAFSEWEHRVHPEDLKSTLKTIEKGIKNVDQGYRSEFRLRHKDGSYRWISAQASFIQNKEGHPVRMVGSHLDVTEQKQAAVEKHKLDLRIKQAQKMESIGTLAGGIAHDFNNILSAIIGFTELSLDEVPKGTDFEDNLQEVYAAGKRAKELVGQILVFARQSDEETKPVQVSVIAKEVLKLIRASIPATIDINAKIESDSLIMGSPTQVHQIFMNLFTNAAHAMEHQGGILELIINEIQLPADDTLQIHGLMPGSYLQIKVSDTGEGIPDNIIHSIFEPYFTTKASGEGTGMGLAVVHGIIESYGGLINVDSNPGKGTTFVIYLPTLKKQSPEQLYEPEVLPHGTERILFVDDEASIAKMGSKVLDKLGYSVTIRTSSVEALELFKSKPKYFDLVISDMTMPNMTGDKLAFELINIRPDIPIIICTGYSKQMTAETAKEIGIKAFAYKPVIKAALAKTVRKVLNEAQGSAHA